MRTLGWLTVSLTYFLMVWGNGMVSIGSGLPSSSGSLPVVLEWGSRVLAFSAAVLTLTTLYKAFTSSAHSGSTLRRSGRSLLILLGVQMLLGGTTVFFGRSPLMSTLHLISATLVFSGLITVACVMTWENPVVANPIPKVQRLALAGLGGMGVQFFLGALVRNSHAGLACPNFPKCSDSFLPLPFTFETALAFFHRWWGILMLGLFFHLALAAAKTLPALAKPTRRAFGLAVAQVFLGIGTVMSGLHTDSRVIHAAVGYLLWGILFYVAVRAGGVRWMWQSETSPQNR